MPSSGARPPSGEQHRIVSGRWSAVVTEVGAAVRELRVDGRAIVDGFAEDAMCSGFRGLPLLPWPNRIEDGRYTFDGAEYQLPIDRVAEHNAIHGLTCWSSWRASRADASRVTLALDLAPRPGYPFACALEIEYALIADGLEVSLRAANAGRGPLPFGAGHHPYFRPRATLDAARIRVPAERLLTLDARGLPVEEISVERTPFDFRAGATLGALRLDHCFGALVRDADGLARVQLDDLVVWMDATFAWLQLYSGDKLRESERRLSLAIEPMTCPPNALRTGRDLMIMRPGEERVMRWGVSLTG